MKIQHKTLIGFGKVLGILKNRFNYNTRQEKVKDLKELRFKLRYATAMWERMEIRELIMTARLSEPKQRKN